MKMKKLALIAATSLVLLASSAQATVYFQNTGVNAGWNSNSFGGSGAKSITEVTNVKYKGSKSLRVICTYPAYRAEKQKNASSNLGQRGNTRFYGFALRLPANWENMNDRDSYFCQNIANYNGNCSGSQDEFEPTFFFGARGSNFKRIYYTGNPCGNNGTGNPGNLRSIIKNSWVRVIYQAKWSSGSDGVMKVWINGTKYFDRTGANTFPYTQPMAFKAGIYIPGWKNSKGSSSQSEKKTWMDHFRVGTSYNEVNPSNW